MKMNRTIVGWQDFLELVLASWIIVSPFVLGFFDQSTASLTTMLLGSVIVLFALLGLATENPYDEWINFVLGAFLIASPWILGFSTLMAATINAAVCGGVLISLTILAMTHEYHEMSESQVVKEG